MRFEGKVVVITGAAQGIGRATAERFLSEGARVVIADVNEERLKATATDIGSPDTLLSVATDVSRKDQVEALVAKAVERFGHIDVMVNNAGRKPTTRCWT
jgi:NAD(P)-dependent dehydrogenase (short-subunit alcohol dehydrogenase family)